MRVRDASCTRLGGSRVPAPCAEKFPEIPQHLVDKGYSKCVGISNDLCSFETCNRCYIMLLDSLRGILKYAVSLL